MIQESNKEQGVFEVAVNEWSMPYFSQIQGPLGQIFPQHGVEFQSGF